MDKNFIKSWDYAPRTRANAGRLIPLRTHVCAYLIKVLLDFFQKIAGVDGVHGLFPFMNTASNNCIRGVSLSK